VQQNLDDYNAQMHWAHQRRPDGWRSPWEVLDGAQGRPIDAETLRRAFFTLRFERSLDAHGHARFRHWKVYAERGLAGCQVGVWLYGPQLTLEYREEPLAEYRVTYAPGKRRFKAVTSHRLFETPFRSPQPWLFLLNDEHWRKAWPVAAYAPRRPSRSSDAIQLPLFPDDPPHTSSA
jgi:hypothetical protein